jgi:hypothetical protein
MPRAKPVMSLSSISWHIGRLGGSSSPRCQSPPSPKEWLALVGSTVGRHCRSEPQQECVPARSPRRGTLPRRRQRLVQNSSSGSRSSGVSSSGRDCWRRTTRRVRSCHGFGWVLVVVSPWSPRSADVTTIRCPRPGVSQGGAGLDGGLSRHGNEPGRPRRLGFHGTLSARSYSGSGNAPSPKGGDVAATASGRISPPKSVVSLTQGDGR